MTLLAPDIVEAILNGMHCSDVTLATMMRPFSADWARQRAFWGLLPRQDRKHRHGQGTTGSIAALRPAGRRLSKASAFHTTRTTVGMEETGPIAALYR
jgi:hypothetical protein